MSFCPSCGSTSIEAREASGEAVCTECGVVVEENVIVSSVEFEETAAGTSRMMGVVVGADRTRAFSNNRKEFSSRGDSREITLAKGRKRIEDVAMRLRLPSHFVDGAHRIFSIAVKENLVQGRRSGHVVAACLYMACRQEKSQHMLIDFSDALQVNVYTLGHCFLKLRRKLGFKLEIIDPALYVYRFASHLDLGEKATQVSLTAVRLVARMKRDWIVTGRRPQGICAAALLVAARAHGIEEDVDVSRVLNICGMTVTTRLKEFARTGASNLSLEEFTNNRTTTDALVDEADPPVWTRNKVKELRAKAIKAGAFDWIESGAADAESGPGWRKAKRLTDGRKKMQKMYEEVGRKLKEGDEPSTKESENEEDAEEDEANEGNDEDQESIEEEEEEATAENPTKETAIVLKDPSPEKEIPEAWKEVYPKGGNGKALVLATDVTEEEQLPPLALTEGKLDVEEFQATMPDFMESELDDMFRTEDEYAQREAVFNRVNKEYLEKQERKENERKAAEAARKDLSETDAAQAAGQAKYKKRLRKNANATVEEKLKETMESRRVSRKINYDALSCVFGDDGAFDTTDVPDFEEEEEMFEGL